MLETGEDNVRHAGPNAYGGNEVEGDWSFREAQEQTVRGIWRWRRLSLGWKRRA